MRLVVFYLFFFPTFLFSQTKIKLTDFATGIPGPVDIAHCDDSRLFVIEKAGRIWIVDSLGKKSTEPFLDIDALASSGGEQGLLGLAFHPNYAQNGFFFVNYTKNDGDTRVARYSVRSDNPQKADPNSEAILLEADQPYANHNGGCIKFGPDGMLYIGLGDGGSGNDPQANGQKTNTLLGKMLRIDVNGTQLGNYSVPADNPFVGNTAYRPEIWSLGWRNPWRFSFDRLTGDLWVGDVGQNKREEIDFEPKNTPGRNYGWRCYEGTSFTNIGNGAGCQPIGTYQPPVFEYPNPSIGQSVTGGFVYRGSESPGLSGLYLFADYVSGRWWTTRRNADSTFSSQELSKLTAFQYTSFGEDAKGELYVTLYSANKIQRVTELCGTFKASGVASAAVCDSSFSGTIFLEVVGGTGPYTYEWSNGKTEKDIVYLNPGTYSFLAKDANSCEQRDTFTIANLTPAAPVLLQGDTVALCPNDTILLSTSTPLPSEEYRFQWRMDGELVTGAIDSMLLMTRGGIVQVRMIGFCQTAWSNPVVIVPEVVALPDFSVFSDSMVAEPGWAGYQWYQDGKPITGSTAASYVADTSGFYGVLFTSLNGCTYYSGDVEIKVSATEAPAAVRHFLLSPNPARNSVTLSLELQTPQRVAFWMTDLSGRRLFFQDHQGASFNLSIDLQSVPAGTYILTVQLESGSFVRELVKF